MRLTTAVSAKFRRRIRRILSINQAENLLLFNRSEGSNLNEGVSRIATSDRGFHRAHQAYYTDELPQFHHDMWGYLYRHTESDADLRVLSRRMGCIVYDKNRAASGQQGYRLDLNITLRETCTRIINS